MSATMTLGELLDEKLWLDADQIAGIANALGPEALLIPVADLLPGARALAAMRAWQSAVADEEHAAVCLATCGPVDDDERRRLEVAQGDAVAALVVAETALLAVRLDGGADDPAPPPFTQAAKP